MTELIVYCEDMFDSGVEYDGTFSLITGRFYIGYDGTVNNFFIRFPLDIPAGNTVTNCVLNFTVIDYYAGETVKIRISAEAVDNSDRIDDWAEWNAAIKTTAFVEWDIAGAYNNEDSIVSADISSVLNAILSRPNFAQGNYINIFFDDNGTSQSSTNNMLSFNSNIDLFSLSITYSETPVEPPVDPPPGAVADSIQVLLNNVDISGFVTDLNIEMQEGAFCFYFSATVLDGALYASCSPFTDRYNPKIAVVIWSGSQSERFEFLIEEREEVYKNSRFKISGRTVQALLGENFADTITDTAVWFDINSHPWQTGHTDVSHCLEYIKTNFTNFWPGNFYWNVEDFPVYRGQYSASEKYPIDMLKDFAAALGARISPICATGTVMDGGIIIKEYCPFMVLEIVSERFFCANFTGDNILRASSRTLSASKYDSIYVSGPNPYLDRDENDGDGSGGTNADGTGVFDEGGGTGVFEDIIIKIYDADTGNAVSGASVTVDSISGVTDEYGLITVNVEIGATHTIQANHSSYTGTVNTTFIAKSSS